MKYLLDTHVWLWMVAEPERFTPDTAALLEDADNDLLLSVASSWEIGIKYALRKLKLPEPPATYVPAQIAKTGVTSLVIEHAHALRAAALPSHHRDPFDRMLIAQAELEGATLITTDKQFAAYGVATREI